MSPVEKRTSRSTTTAVIVALAGVVAGLGLMWFMVNLASQGGDSVQIRLGDDRFPAGPAESRAASAPIIFGDVAGGGRPIILTHTGDDPLEGWTAIAVILPGKPDDCAVEWDPDEEVFVDCDGDIFATEGEGLTTYPVVVEDGRLYVDINAEFREDDEESDSAG